MWVYILITIIFVFWVRQIHQEDKAITSDSHHYYDVPSYDHSVIYIIACMMKADGKVTKKELAAVKNYLLKMFDEEEAKEKLHLLHDFLDMLDQKKAQDIRPYCIRINQTSYQDRLAFLSLLFQISVADGMISDEEAKLVQQYARFTCIRRIDFANMQLYYTYGYQWKEDEDRRSKYKQRQYEQENEENQNGQNRRGDRTGSQSTAAPSSEKAWAYKTLGVPYNASEKEIKKAYRTLVLQYHPDKQADASDSQKELANEKIKDINRAYDILMEKGS
ncbi:MAG: DnaJ domain-containing protein [Paludibacteraceae bacterium]|nr:DnaJ domain-containing protein [Paludibacteraceae bacterium]